jgi:hypothetical protein
LAQRGTGGIETGETEEETNLGLNTGDFFPVNICMVIGPLDVVLLGLLNYPNPLEHICNKNGGRGER